MGLQTGVTLEDSDHVCELYDKFSLLKYIVLR